MSVQYPVGSRSSKSGTIKREVRIKFSSKSAIRKVLRSFRILPETQRSLKILKVARNLQSFEHNSGVSCFPRNRSLMLVYTRYRAYVSFLFFLLSPVISFLASLFSKYRITNGKIYNLIRNIIQYSLISFLGKTLKYSMIS